MCWKEDIMVTSFAISNFYEWKVSKTSENLGETRDKHVHETPFPDAWFTARKTKKKKMN